MKLKHINLKQGNVKMDNFKKVLRLINIFENSKILEKRKFILQLLEIHTGSGGLFVGSSLCIPSVGSSIGLPVVSSPAFISSVAE